MKLYGNKTSSFVSVTESAFTSESIILESPKFPVTFEGKDIKLQFFNLDEALSLDEEEKEENESTFGPVVVESKTIIKVNPGTTHND